MLNQLAKNWWVLTLRGVFAILFAMTAFFIPGITLTVLVIFFGAYTLVDGVFAVLASLSGRAEHERWWLLLLEGLTGIAVGVLTFLWPAITEAVLLILIAAWAVATGLVEIIAAIRLRKELESEWLLILSGVVSVVFGVILFTQPGQGALAVIWVIGTYALIFGILLIGLSFRLRTLKRTTDLAS